MIVGRRIGYNCLLEIRDSHVATVPLDNPPCIGQLITAGDRVYKVLGVNLNFEDLIPDAPDNTCVLEVGEVWLTTPPVPRMGVSKRIADENFEFFQ